jgi:hypothetical protein
MRVSFSLISLFSFMLPTLLISSFDSNWDGPSIRKIDLGTMTSSTVLVPPADCDTSYYGGYYCEDEHPEVSY